MTQLVELTKSKGCGERKCCVSRWFRQSDGRKLICHHPGANLRLIRLVRGRVGRLKRCAFGKSDDLKTIQKNMDKALAKTNGVPVKVCKSFRRQEGWKSTVKRAFSDRRTQELFAKEFGNQFRKKVLEYRCYGF